MASTRGFTASALALSISRTSVRTATPIPAAQRLGRLYQFQPRTTRPAFVPARRYSAPASQSKVYDFAQIKHISTSPSPGRILIDVREPSEVEQGYIPTAINIPIKSQPDALMLPSHEFEARFGFSKPGADQEVIFYCKSGVRSNAAARLALQVGYKNVVEYRGSWMDWRKQGGNAEMP